MNPRKTGRHASESEPYLAAIDAADMFADPTYQREPDMTRVRKIAHEWDVRLVGVLEVSDRGDNHEDQRYAVIDGNHRMRAAQLLDIAPPLVATVHTGLTVAQEAELFDRLNSQRTRLTTWDHWRARLAADDADCWTIHKAVSSVGLSISDAPKPGQVRCTATLEKLYKLGGRALIVKTLSLCKEAWGRDVSSFDAPVVHGLGLVLNYLPIDVKRLTEALVLVEPRLIKTSALTRRDTMTGSLAKLTAVVITDLYNRQPGRKILVSTRTFGPTARNARSAATK